MILAMLLGVFLLVQCCLPLGAAIQIGADEGFELAKATLCLNGYRLYTDVWNDQPPLHTFIITQVLRHVSPSILAARLVTSGFTAILLASVFFISLRISGLFAATVATALLILSPGFVELSASCMLEIPALSLALAAICVLLLRPETPSGRRHPNEECKVQRAAWLRLLVLPREMVAGVLFGLAFQMKLVDVILLPLAAVILWLCHREWRLGDNIHRPGIRRVGLTAGGAHSRGDVARLLRSLLVLGAASIVSFVAVDSLIERGAFLLHFQQSWSSHFAAAKSFDYGSAKDHPFDWSILLKNWDTVVPALFGTSLFLWRGSLGISRGGPEIRRSEIQGLKVLPMVWLGLMLAVFATHRPWWPYYYIHIAIPLCWCGANGAEATLRSLSDRSKQRKGRCREGFGSFGFEALLGIYVLCALGWMGSRVCLQIDGIRSSPQIHSSLVLREIERLRPFARFIYADESIYSFHTGIPMPPDLGVVPLKRLWAGELTNEQIAEKMQSIQPEVILLRNDAREAPFQDLVFREYRVVYEDPGLRLYTKKGLAKQAGY